MAALALFAAGYAYKMNDCAATIQYMPACRAGKRQVVALL
jgi:hypothetical protein